MAGCRIWIKGYFVTSPFVSHLHFSSTFLKSKRKVKRNDHTLSSLLSHLFHSSRPLQGPKATETWKSVCKQYDSSMSKGKRASTIRGSSTSTQGGRPCGNFEDLPVSGTKGRWLPHLGTTTPRVTFLILVFVTYFSARPFRLVVTLPLWNQPSMFSSPALLPGMTQTRQSFPGLVP